jgi:hypothetical protein
MAHMGACPATTRLARRFTPQDSAGKVPVMNQISVLASLEFTAQEQEFICGLLEGYLEDPTHAVSDEPIVDDIVTKLDMMRCSGYADLDEEDTAA